MNRYFDSYGSDPRRIQYAGSKTDGLSVDYKVKYAQQLQAINPNRSSNIFRVMCVALRSRSFKNV